MRSDLSLHAQVSIPDSRAADLPVIVFSHGFITLGTENHGIFVRAARAANRRGFSTVLFDQQGTGYSDGEYESFRVVSGVAHLMHMAGWATGNVPCNGRAVLFGQSLGSALSVAAAAQLPELVCGLILWNLSGAIERRYPDLFGLSFDSGETQCVAKGYLVGADFLSDAARLDVLALIEKVACPLLLLNCVGDSVADLNIAKEASLRASRSRVTLAEIRATHSFECQRTEERDAVFTSLRWLEEICLNPFS